MKKTSNQSGGLLGHPGWKCVALTRDGTPCMFTASGRVPMRGQAWPVCGNHHQLWDELYAIDAELAARRLLDGVLGEQCSCVWLEANMDGPAELHEMCANCLDKMEQES